MSKKGLLSALKRTEKKNFLLAGLSVIDGKSCSINVFYSDTQKIVLKHIFEDDGKPTEYLRNVVDYLNSNGFKAEYDPIEFLRRQATTVHIHDPDTYSADTLTSAMINNQRENAVLNQER